MAIKKKKRRKKRSPQTRQTETTPNEEQDQKKVYKDDFQSGVGEKIEEFGSKLEGKGKNILYGIAALAVLGVIVGIFYVYNNRKSGEAQAALGRAIETSQAQVTDAPQPAGSLIKTFKTSKARAEAAIKEFEVVANNYGSPYKEKAKYFIAVNRLTLDREAGTKELEEIASASNEAGILAKFALAQVKVEDKKLDEAAKLYQELAALEKPIISKETINYNLANIYEQQEKKKEAVDLYFKITKEATEAKDLDGKPVPLTQTATSAKTKLEELDPEKAKEIKQPEPSEG